MRGWIIGLSIAALLCGNVASAAKAKTTFPYLDAPYDVAEGATTIKGAPWMDYFKLYQTLRKTKLPVKSEFETAAEFAARLEANPIKLYSTLTTASNISIGDFLDYDATTYDAESKTMHITFNIGRIDVERDEGATTGRGHVLFEGSKNVGSYVGQNAFGVKKRITRSVSSEMCVLMKDAEGFTSSFDVPIPVEEARDSKTLAYLFSGKLAYPYTGTYSYRDEPTITSPIDMTHFTSCVIMEKSTRLIIYSIVTKKILVDKRL
jgi:hypothetical protein